MARLRSSSSKLGKGKTPEYQLKYATIQRGVPRPIDKQGRVPHFLLEVAYLDETYWELMDELRAVVMGSTVKIALGVKVYCQAIPGMWQQPTLTIVGVSRATNGEVVLHGPLLFSSNSGCIGEGVEDGKYRLQIRLRAFLAGSSIETSYNQLSTTVDLYTVQEQIHEGLEADDAISADVTPLAPNFVSLTEELAQEFVDKFAIKREEQFGTPERPFDMLNVRLNKDEA